MHAMDIFLIIINLTTYIASIMVNHGLPFEIFKFEKKVLTSYVKITIIAATLPFYKNTTSFLCLQMVLLNIILTMYITKVWNFLGWAGYTHFELFCALIWIWTVLLITFSKYYLITWTILLWTNKCSVVSGAIKDNGHVSPGIICRRSRG